MINALCALYGRRCGFIRLAVFWVMISSNQNLKVDMTQQFMHELTNVISKSLLLHGSDHRLKHVNWAFRKSRLLFRSAKTRLGRSWFNEVVDGGCICSTIVSRQRLYRERTPLKMTTVSSKFEHHTLAY